MARLRSEQARGLWLQTVIRYIGALAAFTVAYLVFGFLFGESLSSELGNWIADSTSSWNYANADDFDRMWDSGVVVHSNLQYLEASDTGVVAFRDLWVYNMLRDLKPLVVVLIYIAVVALITIYFLRKPLHLIDDISQALSDPELPKGGQISLPKDLKPTQSELELLQARIEKSEHAAKESEDRKNELVAYLAHDIRTPLTSVLGYLDLICDAEGIPPERQHEFAAAALAKAQRLEGLVEELFEITRYNTQNIPIERELLDVQLLCQQIAEEFYPQANAKKIKIGVDVEEGLSCFMDSSRMGRALENVVKNAIVHASENSQIGLKAHSKDEKINITVTNEGKEISPEHLEHIFERFYRGDSARSQDAGGAGLGLAIAKEIVEAHDGNIKATSNLGTTTFEIVIPQSAMKSE